MSLKNTNLSRHGPAFNDVPKDLQAHVTYVSFAAPVPTRRVVLAWRRTFTRYEAIAALRNAIYACELSGVKRLS